MATAPPSCFRCEPSLAGWNTNTTAPGKTPLTEASADEAPTSIAVWQSCPQACAARTIARVVVGHSSIAMTAQHYQKVSPRIEDDADAGIAAAFRPPAQSSTGKSRSGP
jgi:hypothetical protein